RCGSTVRRPDTGTSTLPLDGTYLIEIPAAAGIPHPHVTAVQTCAPPFGTFTVGGTTSQSNGQPLAGVTITFTRVAGSGAVPAAEIGRASWRGGGGGSAVGGSWREMGRRATATGGAPWSLGTDRAWDAGVG